MRDLRLALPAALAVFSSACASVHTLDTTSPALSGRIISEEMIASSQAVNAWQVLQQSGYYRMIDEPSGSRSGVHSRRGKSSILLTNSDVPRLIVDGARVSDLGQLREIPASSIAWIQLLSGIEGGMEEGPNSGGGVIRIVSKVGR